VRPTFPTGGRGASSASVTRPGDGAWGLLSGYQLSGGWALIVSAYHSNDFFGVRSCVS
jgi:hypothetical protein